MSNEKQTPNEHNQNATIEPKKTNHDTERKTSPNHGEPRSDRSHENSDGSKGSNSEKKLVNDSREGTSGKDAKPGEQRMGQKGDPTPNKNNIPQDKKKW